jgi:hypothetical protein
MQPSKPTARRSSAAPILDLTSPDHALIQFYLTCFRGRKFARGRFARLVMERVANQDGNDKLLLQLPVAFIGLFLAREVVPVAEDHSPANECFEMPDGNLLEFVGDHMEAAETVARTFMAHDEDLFTHIVDLLREHERTWFHTMTLEGRDEYLRELGFFPALDDSDRLFERWHPHLLLRKLQATLGLTREEMDANLAAKKKVSPTRVNAFFKKLRGQEKKLALRRLGFLAMCQAVRDTRRKVQLMTPEQMQKSAQTAIEPLAIGATASGFDTS